jgi:hypothetical protein
MELQGHWGKNLSCTVPWKVESGSAWRWYRFRSTDRIKSTPVFFNTKKTGSDSFDSWRTGRSSYTLDTWRPSPPREPAACGPSSWPPPCRTPHSGTASPRARTRCVSACVSGWWRWWCSPARRRAAADLRRARCSYVGPAFSPAPSGGGCSLSRFGFRADLKFPTKPNSELKRSS